MRYRKCGIFILIISILSIIAGYFLWAILFPVQDLGMMSQEEILVLQKDVALNYEFGKGMMWSGVCGIWFGLFLFFKR